MGGKMTRTIEVQPGYDRRDADPKLDRGMHGCEFMFVLSGPKGSLTFRCYTDWLPKALQERDVQMAGGRRSNIIGIQPAPVDMVVHSPVQLTFAQTIERRDCPYTATGICYSTTHNNTAPHLRDVLLAEGSEGVWREMQQRYRSAFSVTQLGPLPTKRQKVQG